VRLIQNLGRLVPVLCLALLWAGAPTPSRAQGLPSGSYANSCNNARMVSGVLEASCQRADGSWMDAAMPNPGSCRNGIENRNGVLACANPPQASLTSQTSDGITYLNNTCGAQQAIFAIATNNNVTTGLIIILKAGQSVQLGVTRGSSFTMNCGTPPTDLVHLRYFSISPAQ
jgi:hypothetical protein